MRLGDRPSVRGGLLRLHDRVRARAIRPSDVHDVPDQTVPRRFEGIGDAGAADQSGNRFDVIVIDMPPLLPVTDAALATSQADCGYLRNLRPGRGTGGLAADPRQAAGPVFVRDAAR